MTEIKKTEKDTSTIALPVYVYEGEQARHERREKRLVIAVIIAVILLFLSNCVWIWYISQFDFCTEDVTLGNEGDGNTNYIGQDGDINNGVHPSS